jgi:DNA polymerase III gamma/tau subunit
MLKLLEEAPDHAYFILCTTDPEKLLPTIKTRCSEVKLKTVQPDDMAKYILTVAKKEEYDIDEFVLDVVVKESQGSPRMAMMLLEQCINFAGSSEDLIALLQDKSKDQSETVSALCKAIMEQGTKWKDVASIIKQLLVDNEPETIRYAIAGWYSAQLLAGGWGKNVGLVAEVLEFWLDNFYDRKKAGVIFAAYCSWNLVNGK